MKLTSKIFLALLACLLVSQVYAQLQPRNPKRVAIFLYQNVELLDFAGPGEVFSAAGFETYTVSVDGKELMSQGFVKIQPAYAISNAPAPDIIVVPGGSSGPSANDTRVIDWIKKNNNNGSSFMSVCTGAFILAKAGLLENKRVTTHWGSTESLSKSLPSATVLEDTRFVDNGSVITTAGVSAGIDGALHFVSRIKGLEAAKRTARYMEYDKWNPALGVVDQHNAYLETLVSQPADSKTPAAPAGELNAASPAPYEGEFSNLAATLQAEGQYAKAARVLQEGVRIYPSSSLLYGQLGTVYGQAGKPAPAPENKLIGMITSGQVDAAIAQIEKDKKAFPGWKIFSEEQFNTAGYELLYKKGDVNGALKLFRFIVREFPESWNAYDSLGEAYLKAGKKDEAIAYYKKSLALNDGNDNARKVLKEIGAI